MADITHELERDIEAIVQSMFEKGQWSDNKLIDDFMDGFAPKDSLPQLVGMWMIAKGDHLRIVIPILIILAEHRGIPLKQMGVYFRRILLRRLETEFLEEIAKGFPKQ